MSNIEKISAYLENEMSVEERHEFEQAVANDPELKSELDLQKDIIEGIKNERISELKAIMNNVPVGGSLGVGGTITFGKLASGIAILGLITLGAYYYFGSETDEFMPPKAIESIELAEDHEGDIDEDQATTAIESEDSETTEQSDNTLATAEPSKKTSASSTDNKVTEPEINRPSAAPLFETSESDSLEAPTNEIVDNIERNLTSLDVEIDNTKKKYSFHYQFNGGKLFLYGDFDKELYEILEFKSKYDKTLFLYYEGKFYPLNKKQVKIIELKPVKERSLIEKLEKVVEID